MPCYRNHRQSHGTLPFLLIDAGSASGAYRTLIVTADLSGVSDPLPSLLLYFFLFSAMVFFILYYIGYLRRRLLQAEPELAQVIPEETFHDAFGPVTSSRWPLVFGAIFAIVAVASPIFAGIFPALGTFGRIDFLVIYVFIGFIFVDLIWVYSRSVWSLYNIGKGSLRLQSYLDDDMLGVRPFGSLSLSISLGYFGSLALLLLISLSAPITAFRTPPQLFGILVFLAIGLLLFVLPLTSVHKKMFEEKQRIKAQQRAEFRRLTSGNGLSPPGSSSRIELILLHEVNERRIGAIPTWPFDTGIIGRFVAILLSVIAILISTILKDFLRF